MTDNAAPAATPANAAPAVVASPAKPATATEPKPKIRVLYLFAGKPRKWDMRDCLTKLGYEQGVDIQIDSLQDQGEEQATASNPGGGV